MMSCRYSSGKTLETFVLPTLSQTYAKYWKLNLFGAFVHLALHLPKMPRGISRLPRRSDSMTKMRRSKFTVRGWDITNTTTTTMVAAVPHHRAFALLRWPLLRACYLLINTSADLLTLWVNLGYFEPSNDRCSCVVLFTRCWLTPNFTHIDSCIRKNFTPLLYSALEQNMELLLSLRKAIFERRWDSLRAYTYMCMCVYGFGFSFPQGVSNSWREKRWRGMALKKLCKCFWTTTQKEAELHAKVTCWSWEHLFVMILKPKWAYIREL